MKLVFFTNKKLFTVVVLKAHKMIWFMRHWQPYCTTWVPAVFAHTSYFQQVAIAVLKLSYTNLVFIEPGTKINRQY